MALHEYRWCGSTWQIDDKDLDRYPGAVPVEEKKTGEKKKTTPANKARRAPKDK
jgi:hypothetical protein